MKTFLLSILMTLTMFTASAFAQSPDYTSWERILNTFVNEQGRVDYEGLKANRVPLDTFIQTQIENADISKLEGNQLKAFWINAYNALTLRLIVDNYPLKFGGIRTINWGKPWDIKMKAAGRELSLNGIEHGILRKWDPIDPRIHFAINCASVGCPKIPNTHFDPGRLNEQLDHEARRFFNDPEKTKLDRKKNTVYHSEILNWFKEDFLAVSETKLDYILKYLNDEDTAYISQNRNKVKIKKIKYDWGLNKQEGDASK